MAQHYSAPLRGLGGDDDRPYREMVERVPAVVYVDASDELSSAIYMSPRAEQMLGYSPQEWLDEPGMWVRLLHEEDRERVLAEQGRTRRTGETFLAEYRLMAKDGRVVWVRDEAELVEEAGRPPAWHGVLVDVTDRKEAEAALARSEERFRQLVENAGEGIARISPEGRIEYCNPAYAEILGQPRTGRWDGRSSSSWRARTRRRPGASGS